MFEQFFPNNELKAQRESEKEHIALAKEQSSMSAAIADQAFVQEQNQKSDLIRWQQELDVGLEILKHRLRSETVNSEGQWIKKMDVAPLLTEAGINMVETELSPFLGEEAKNLINTNLDELRILNMLRNTSDTIVDNLADYYDVYVIDATPSKMSHICRLIKNTMIPTPFRCLNGFTKKQDNMGIRRIETYNDSPNTEKKKLFGVL